MLTILVILVALVVVEKFNSEEVIDAFTDHGINTFSREIELEPIKCRVVAASYYGTGIASVH